MDVVVRGGTVVDGTGAPAFRADVGIRGGRVVALGSVGGLAARELDATGLVVAPGFVDIHSHSDLTLLVDPRAQSAIAQGVTTELVGNCGHGCAPLTAERERFAGNIYGYVPEASLDWRTVGEYLDRLESARPAVNVATLVPNGSLRLAALRRPDRPANAEERSRITRLLDEGLDDGAFGLSVGLEYPAERACTEEELAALCRVVARRGRLCAMHTRNRDVRAAEAIEESLRAARAAGAALQISHLVPRRGGPPDALERSLAVVDAARGRGQDVSFDQHTRLFGFTSLSAALPLWALEGGRDAIAARLRDNVTRARLKSYQSVISSFGLSGWGRVFVVDAPHRRDIAGKSLAALAPAAGDAYDVVFDVLLAELDDLQRPMCVCWSYEEEELARAFVHPACMIGSDATTLSPDGPLARAVFHGAYTWAAWFFRRFVRERRLLTLEDAVRRLAALPADRVGLRGRGVLREGAWADVIAFDPARFAERGTLEEPGQLSEGMVHVVVNGEVALGEGHFTGRRPGRVLRA